MAGVSRPRVLWRWPASQITSIVQGNRNVGLGVMGFAELLILLGISYASKQSILLAEDLMQFISEQLCFATAVKGSRCWSWTKTQPLTNTSILPSAIRMLVSCRVGRFNHLCPLLFLAL
jgi:hypothetical protein